MINKKYILIFNNKIVYWVVYEINLFKSKMVLDFNYGFCDNYFLFYFKFEVYRFKYCDNYFFYINCV